MSAEILSSAVVGVAMWLLVSWLSRYFLGRWSWSGLKYLTAQNDCTHVRVKSRYHARYGKDRRLPKQAHRATTLWQYPWLT